MPEVFNPALSYNHIELSASVLLLFPHRSRKSFAPCSYSSQMLTQQLHSGCRNSYLCLGSLTLDRVGHLFGVCQNGVSTPFESACSLHVWCGHVLGSVSGCLGGDLCGCLLGDTIHFHQILQVGRDSAFTLPCSFGCGFNIVYACLTAYVLTPSLRGDIAISHSEMPKQVLKENFGLRN